MGNAAADDAGAADRVATGDPAPHPAMTNAAITIPALTACTPKPVSCQAVIFAPRSDWMAISITATSTNCTTARQLAYTAKYYTRGSGPFHYRAFGFTCRGYGVTPQGLAYTHYDCSNTNGAKVTFDYY